MNNLKHFREDKGLTQEDVAKALNKQQSTISAYENGTIKPSLLMAIQLAELLQVSVEDIFL